MVQDCRVSEVQPEPVPSRTRAATRSSRAHLESHPESHRAATAWPLRVVFVLVAVVALVAGLLGGLGGRLVAEPRRRGATGSVSLLAAPSGTTARPPGSVAGVVRRVLPSVVTLKVAGGEEADTGSGFVLRSDGYVVTNNHVVAAAAGGGTISVVFADGRSAKGTVVGSDTSYDLAVVKVARTGLPELRLGESKDVVVGDPVIAVGAPLGLQGSVTTGIVSALNRPVTAGGEADRVVVHQRDPDRRGDQPGQLRRPAGRRRRAT